VNQGLKAGAAALDVTDCIGGHKAHRKIDSLALRCGPTNSAIHHSRHDCITRPASRHF